MVDLMGHQHLGGKTLLYILDGLWGFPLHGGGSSRPARWRSTPFDDDYPSSLLVSQDPVAIDSVALDFLREEFGDDMGGAGLEGGIDDYLHEAALANDPPSGTFYDPEADGTGLGSLGVHEHWNNPSDKQYSRNLGLGDGIELLYVRAVLDYGTSHCDDGADNDGDGHIDWNGGPLGEPADPGCADASDLSERDPVLVCDDGADNDGDGRIDFDPATHSAPGDQHTPPSGSGDPGCISPIGSSESPSCQDGIDNDGDGRMDHDAGLLANGSADPAGPDSHCVGQPWLIIEGLPCGLGVELVLLLPPLMWLYRRQRRASA
jgi:hypothetical protein